MTNRKTAIDLISKSQDELLSDELDYFMSEDRDYSYDLADALDDALTFAEENNERKLIKTIRLILIEAGYWIEAPEKTDCGRDTRVTVNATKYSPVGYWDGWINE